MVIAGRDIHFFFDRWYLCRVLVNPARQLRELWYTRYGFSYDVGCFFCEDFWWVFDRQISATIESKVSSMNQRALVAGAEKPPLFHRTLPETNSQFAPRNRPKPKRKGPSIFRCESVRFRVCTHPKSNIDTKNDVFFKCISFQKWLLWVSMLVFRVCKCFH